MTNRGESEWAPPTEPTPKTHDELVNAAYPLDAENVDDMVVHVGGEKQMIEVPAEWKKGAQTEPAEGDAGYEAGFDDNPFAEGKEVNVKRNGKNGNPDYQEGGWKIVNSDANVRVGEGKYVVGVVVEKVIDGESFQKSITLQDLMTYNPRVEKEPNVDADFAEEIGEEALEASGVEDPTDIDSLKAASEAAQRVVGESAPVIPDLEARMSGEAAVEAIDPLIALTEGLSDSDRMELRSYANAKIGKQEAQHQGDGHRSTQEGQYMGQSLRAMSPAAKAIADRYATLYARKS